MFLLLITSHKIALLGSSCLLVYMLTRRSHNDWPKMVWSSILGFQNVRFLLAAGDSFLCFKAFHIHFKQTTDFSAFSCASEKLIYSLRVEQSESLSFLRFITMYNYVLLPFSCISEIVIQLCIKGPLKNAVTTNHYYQSL